MPDSIRLKEIHAMLGAAEWAADTTNGSSPDNFWRSIKRIKEVLGLKNDYKNRAIPISIKQRVFIKEGASLPPGYLFGQWGENGIAVESIPNRFYTDVFGVKTIKSGGAVLCHTIPQLIAELVDQLDAALGLQEAAAFKMPNAQGTKVVEFEGLHALLAEVAYTLSQISEDTSKAYITGMTIQGTVQETLTGLGLPIETKEMTVDFGNSKKQLPYMGIVSGSPTISKLIGWVLKNLSLLVGGKVKE